MNTNQINDWNALLYEKLKKLGHTGIHYCPDWDDLVISDQTSEKECCLCNIEE